MMEVLILIFYNWPLNLSLPSILHLILQYYHAPPTNINILHFNSLCKFYKVISILDYKSLMLALYTKCKDSIVNWPTLTLKAYRERKNPVCYLRPHFTNPEGLLDAMAKSNVYILGSCAADYFVPGSAELYFDFDFYV